MESKQHMPSVIARLMGIGELSSQQPVQKRQRVLSDKYLKRVASLGVQENSRYYKYLSRENSDAVKEQKEVEAAGKQHKGKFYSRWDQKGKAKSGSRELKAEFNGLKSTDFRCFSEDERHLSLRKTNNVTKSPISYGYRSLKLKGEYKDLLTRNLHAPSQTQAKKNTTLRSSSAFYCISSNVCRNAGNKTAQVKLLQFSRCRLYAKERAHLSRTSTLGEEMKFNNLSHNPGASWKDKHFGFPRSGHFSLLQGQRTGRNKVLNDNRYMRREEYARKVPPRTEMQDGSQKNCLDSRLLRSSDKKSQSFAHFVTRNNYSSFGKYLTVYGQSKTDQQKDICQTSVVASPSLNESSDFMKDDDSCSQSADGSLQQDTSLLYSEDGSGLSQYSGTDRESFTSLEGYQPSPDSVLDSYFKNDCQVTRAKCLWGDSLADFHGLKMHLELLTSGPFEAYSEGSEVNVSSDEEIGEESICCPQENRDVMRVFRIEESRDFSYLVDVLNEGRFLERNLDKGYNQWHMSDCPIGLHVFETLEKRYGEQTCWKRSERRLLFDRINIGLVEIFMPSMGVPTWTKPVSKRLPGQFKEAIEDELWTLLVKQETEACNVLSKKVVADFDGWISLGDYVEMIVLELEKMLVDELAGEIVRIGSF